jgi:hypothetical protein
MDESVLAKIARIRRGAFRIVFLALVLIAAWLLDHLGAGSGLGLLPEPSIVATAPSRPVQGSLLITSQAMQVTIREDGYFIDGNQKSLSDIVEDASHARPATGPAVRIVSGPESRVGAERDLEMALDEANLPWTLEAGTAEAP